MCAKREQVESEGVSIREIIADPKFALGAADARAGRGYHRNYDRWDIDDQWNYERGRAWGATAPRDLAISVNGKITGAAVWHFRRAQIL